MGTLELHIPKHKRRRRATGNHRGRRRRLRMARNSGKDRRHWTNERHVNFLNSMEASFVQSMLQNTARFPPPLDRYLPGNSDSTHDFDNCRPPTSFLSPSPSDNVESSGRRTEKKTRILACQKSSQDQVVPQFQNKRDDKDKDDKDHLHVSIRTAH